MDSNGKLLAFIPDGYTREGYVEGVRGLYPSVRFTYRPMGNLQRGPAIAAIKTATPAGAESFTAKMLEQRVLKWDITDEHGDPWPVTYENCCRIQPHLFTQMYLIVIGERASDPLPLDSEQSEEEARAAFEAAISGTSVVEVLEKNS